MEREANLRPGRGRELRPDESNGAGHEGRGDARPAKGERWAVRPKTHDLFARRPQAVPADGTAEIRLIDGFALQITSRHGYDPRVAGDDRTADFALIAGGRHDHRAAPSGVVERELQRALAF